MRSVESPQFTDNNFEIRSLLMEELPRERVVAQRSG
jgi:hypothetical protein